MRSIRVRACHSGTSPIILSGTVSVDNPFDFNVYLHGPGMRPLDTRTSPRWPEHGWQPQPGHRMAEDCLTSDRVRDADGHLDLREWMTDGTNEFIVTPNGLGPESGLVPRRLEESHSKGMASGYRGGL